MALNYYNAFSESESESEEEDNFEESSFELYKNKQNFQTVFSNKLLGTAGYYFFPRTYDEAALLMTFLDIYKDRETLFNVYSFSPLLVDKINKLHIIGIQ